VLGSSVLGRFNEGAVLRVQPRDGYDSNTVSSIPEYGKGRDHWLITFVRCGERQTPKVARMEHWVVR
jgi:hypothetical protein